MAKTTKNKLPIEWDVSDNSDLILIGIACHLKDYRLCWSLNDKLGINMYRINDLIVETKGKTNTINRFPSYFYDDTDKLENYFLIENHAYSGDLLVKQTNADYLLLISGMNKAKETPILVKRIKEIIQVLTAFKIETTDVSNIEAIISDLELLLIQPRRDSSILQKEKGE
jgi:hypothetical protein